MICPKCNEEIEHVIVISECSQRGTLEGNRVVEYDELTAGATRWIECPKCSEVIDEAVVES